MTPTNNPQQPQQPQQGWYDQLKNMIFANGLLRQLAGAQNPAQVNQPQVPSQSTDPTALQKIVNAQMALQQPQPTAILATPPKKKASKK